jgi:capsular polysaccharide transport system ATP-binding protein
MIKLEDVCKSYPTRSGQVQILHNINLTLARGEKIGILGGNGSGKSTLIRLISGIELPTSGRITRTMRLSWPLAFAGAFQGALTGYDNIRFICRIYEVEFDSVVDFIQDFSQLGPYLREPLKVYSAGMRARLAFAVSMMIEFDCYLIDEVVAVGDSRFQHRCHEELVEKRWDRAKIIVSHDPRYLREHCDRGAVFANKELMHFEKVGDAIDFHEHAMAIRH